MSGVYAFSLAAIALLLKLQVDKLEAGDVAFVAIAVVGWVTMALVARTHSLATRQASYIEVFFERGNERSWVTRSRLAWNHMPESGAVRWTRRFSEQKVFCLLLLFAQIASAWLLMLHYAPAMPMGHRMWICVGATTLLLTFAYLLPRHLDHWKKKLVFGGLFFATFSYVGVVLLLQPDIATQKYALGRGVGIVITGIDLAFLVFTTRDTGRAWTKMWEHVRDNEAALQSTAEPSLDGCSLLLGGVVLFALLGTLLWFSFHA
jgi:hypothetical protein